MKIIDINGNIIPESEVDLNIGYTTKTTIIKDSATPIDNITKFAYYDEDYEEVLMYIEKREDSPSNHGSSLPQYANEGDIFYLKS